MAAVLVFLVFLLLIAAGVPIAVGMIFGAAAPAILLGEGSSLGQIVNNCFSGANSTPILAVPLFILAGVLMAEGGISKRLFRVFAYFVGRFPGGMPCACVLTCLFYGAISGSGPATTAAVGAMCLPFLTELGYDKTRMAGLIAVAGGLGVIIPPSIPFVLYSLATGVSTGDLFLAGIVPGIVIGVLLMAFAVTDAKKNGEDREKIDAQLSEIRADGLAPLLKESFWALLSPVIVLGGIYSGYFTPTEAASVSAVYALIVSVCIYKTVDLRNLPALLGKAVAGYAPLAFVLAFATAFGRVLSLTGASGAIQTFMLGNFRSPWSFMLVTVLLFLALGTVMDTGPAIIILAPLLLPIAQALGIGGVKYGVVLVCCLSIGLATPPFGLDLFVAAKLAECDSMAVAKKALPYMLLFSLAILLVALL